MYTLIACGTCSSSVEGRAESIPNQQENYKGTTNMAQETKTEQGKMQTKRPHK